MAGKARKSVSNKTAASDNRTFEAKLWEACEAQRGSVNASRYKHPVLGLVFLKYVNDSFTNYRTELAQRLADPSDQDFYLEDETDRLDVLEDRDEYTAKNVFWIPEDARWEVVRSNAPQPDIATRIDKVMDAIERENPVLKGVLPKSFAASEIPQRNLTSLINIVDSIAFGDDDHDGRDKLGQVYEYFLGKFSGIEGRAGEDYTPRSVVELLVEMLQPYKGRIYDPCCGTGGMFVQSRRFLEAHGGNNNDLSVYGQESNPETWRLAKMNLALHGIDGNLADRADSSFTADLHPDLRADFIITNPPFNLGEKGKTGWGRDQLLEDARWQVNGETLLPPESNANYAWIQHFLYHLAPEGVAGFVLANGALSNVNRTEEVAIRKALVEAGVVDCIVSLPTKLFANTSIPVSLWFVSKNRGLTDEFRDRRDETLFIDARKLGYLSSRRHKELSREDILQIAETYHAFRSTSPKTAYEDIQGFCRVVKREEIESKFYVLSPRRYVGSTVSEEGLNPEEQLTRLTEAFTDITTKTAELDTELRSVLSVSRLEDPQDLNCHRTRLLDVATVTSGYSYRSHELTDSSKTALVNLKNFNRHGGFNPKGLKPLQANVKDSVRVSTGDLLVAKTDLTQEAEVVGRVVRVPLIQGYKYFVASVDTAIITPKFGYTREFLYAILSSDDFREHCLSYATGTTVLHLAKQAFIDYEFDMPPDETIKVIEKQVLLMDQMSQLADSRQEVLGQITELATRFVLAKPNTEVG